MWLVFKYLHATSTLQVVNATFTNNPKFKNVKLDYNKLSGSVTFTYCNDMTNIEEINSNGLFFIQVEVILHVVEFENKVRSKYFLFLTFYALK